MQDLSREAILRMVGLHDSAQFMRQINAIQLSLEEQGGQMVAYWTEIRKDERQITLIAGRVSANETSIGQLQVTAQQLTASVSSLTTTVNGHTTSIGQLQITADNLTASVSSLNTTVSSHTTSIGQLQVTANSLTASVSSLNTTVGGHTTKIAALELTDTSISQRVTVIEGDYVTSADLSLYVDKNSVSWLTGNANNVIFNFTQRFQIQHSGTAVLEVTASGDLKITGNLLANSEIGTVQPIRVNSSGEIERKSPDNTWVPNYAGRYAAAKTSNYTCLNTDDFIIAANASTDISITLPSNPSDGKVITVQNTGRTTVIYNGSGSSGIKTSGYILTRVDLNNYDRADFVFYSNYWYAVYMSSM